MNIHWKDWCWSWSSNNLGTLMWRTDSFENILMLGKIEGRRRRGQQRRRWLDCFTDSMDMSLSRLWELVMDSCGGVLHPWGRQELDMTDRLNWTESSQQPWPLGVLSSPFYRWRSWWLARLQIFELWSSRAGIWTPVCLGHCEFYNGDGAVCAGVCWGFTCWWALGPVVCSNSR